MLDIGLLIIIAFNFFPSSFNSYPTKTFTFKIGIFSILHKKLQILNYVSKKDVGCKIRVVKSKSWLRLYFTAYRYNTLDNILLDDLD